MNQLVNIRKGSLILCKLVYYHTHLNFQRNPLSMNIHIQFTDRNLQNNAGTSIFSKFLLDRQFINVFKRYGVSVKPNNRETFSDLNIIQSAILLMANGFSNFENIDHLKHDLIIKKILGSQSIPSKETFRQRLDKLSKNTFVFDLLVNFNLNILKKHSDPKCIKNTDLVPLDFDVSVFDNTGSKKEGVSQTYKPKIKGFAPMFAYLGSQGYSINMQFRKGSAHSNTAGTLEFITETVFMSRQLCKDKKLLIRLDSGNDSDKNIIGLTSIPNSHFIVKYQPRGRNVNEMKSTLTEYVMNNFTRKSVMENGTVRYFAEQKTIAKIINEDDTIHTVECRRILSVVEINRDLNTGEELLIPFRSLHMWRTNLPKTKFPPRRILDLYKDHGTSEQFHSEFKTDLDLERMPSQKFDTNDLWLHLSQLAFNILRLIGEASIKILNLDRIRLRLRTVILKIIYTPCWFTRKNNKWTVFLPRKHPTSHYFEKLMSSF